MSILPIVIEWFHNCTLKVDIAVEHPGCDIEIFFIFRRQDDSDEEEVPCSSKKKSKTEINQTKKRLKSIMKKVIDFTDE